jgi:hypothetical protein
MSSATMLVLFALAQQTDTAPKLAGNPCAGPELVGTWQLAEMHGKPAPSESTFYKHVTPTHFVVVSIEPTGQLSYAHGGPYKVSAGTYTESVTHGFGQPFQVVGGSRLEFQCRIEGDRWQTVGGVAGSSFDEVWTRVTVGSKY